MEQFKLKVGRCFALISNHLGGFDLFVTGRRHFFIERALAIVQQCDNNIDKRSAERSNCWTRLRISGKGVHMYKSVGVRFADFLIFLKYPM